MKAQIAYEAYRVSLKSRTRNWHELKRNKEHEDKSDEVFDAWLKENKASMLSRYYMGEFDAMPPHSQAGWGHLLIMHPTEMKTLGLVTSQRLV